jgi:hypothetical protein
MSQAQQVAGDVKLTNWTNSLTDYMEQSPSWEADNHSASQEIPRRVMEPEDSLPCSQNPATGACPEPDAYRLHIHTPFP